MIARSVNLGFFQLDDSLIAIDKQSGYCYALNSTGARIWEMLSSPARIESICDSLCTEFDVQPDVCSRDVAEIVSAMKDAGLVTIWRE